MMTNFCYTIKANLKHVLMVIKNCSVLAAKGDFASIVMHGKNRINRYRTAKPLNVKPGDTVTVLTTPHTLFLAELIRSELSAAGYYAEVVVGTKKVRYGRHLYFVICPQMFKKLPRLYFAVQMEQSVSPRWFNKRYFRMLSGSVAILDYSKQNIKYLLNQGFAYSKIYYVPVSLFSNYLDHVGIDNAPACKDQKPYDVVFYGDTRNPRRAKILREIGKHFKLLLINNLFSVDLYKKLMTARVVVNLHYYENALLETTRIYECLSLGLPVVSENGVDHAEHENLNGLVDFVETGDIPGILQSIRRVLDSAGSKQTTITNELKKPQQTNRFAFYFNRVLLAFDLVDFDYFNSRFEGHIQHNTSPKCLTLTETPVRQMAFEVKHSNSFELVEGLRHKLSWIGCAMSYKFYAAHTLRNEAQQLLMCEDDVILPHDYKEKINTVLRYLEQQVIAWDIFSGFIAHLNEGTEILDVEVFEGIEFIKLNKMTSMVFNLYAAKALQLISVWDPSDRKMAHNTIDRYLENENLCVVTTLPFLVGHDDQASSTLWGISNDEYNPLIEKSESLLRKKVEDFKTQKKEAVSQQIPYQYTAVLEVNRPQHPRH